MFILFRFARSLSGVVVPQAPCCSLDGGAAVSARLSIGDGRACRTTRVHTTIRQQPLPAPPASLMGERTEIEAIQTGCAQPLEHPAAGGPRSSGKRREPRRRAGQGG